MGQSGISLHTPKIILWTLTGTHTFKANTD